MGRHTLKPVLNVALKKYRPPENTNWNFKLLAALQSHCKWQRWKMHWKSSNYRRTPLVIETYLYF